MNAPRRQRGVALLILVAIVVIGVSWMLVTAVGNASQRSTANREHNARVMAEAKAALIGWIATQALLSSESDPGRLPCPQAWTDVNTANEGRAAASCTAPAVGWLPWRELGLPKLVDNAGNQLWYVVSPGWHLTGAGNLTINSNTAGGITVGGQKAVALIIAPGPAIGIVPNANQTAAGCSSRNQSRNLSSPLTTDVRDYLECMSTATYTYATAVVDNGTNQVFNDQVLTVTTADILPVLEATIAKRIEREIAPVLKTVYASSTWAPSVSSTNPVLPFAAPFGDPTTSNYQGSSAISASKSAGLLPFNQIIGCNPATDPRCTTATTGASAFLVFSKNGNDTYTTSLGGSIKTQSTCSWSGQTYSCTGQYQDFSITVTLRLRVTNVAMGLRTFDSSKVICTAVDDVGAGLPQQNVGCSVSVALQSDGSALVTVTTNPLPNIPDLTVNWGTFANYTISFDRSVFGDHSLLDSTTTTTGSTGWFVRNEWYRLLYYVAASGNTAAGLPSAPSCATASSCLSVTNWTPTADLGKQRGILILAGRSLNGSPRPSSTLGDYLESGNATGSFIKQSVSRPGAFNDRIIVVDTN